MIFGESVRPAVSAAPAEWITDACRGAGWTVGALVPNHYESFIRVGAPDAEIEDWWAAYRDLFEIVASVGQQHTSTADRAWFAIWEGHGFDSFASRVAWSGPVDDATRVMLEQKRRQLREEDERRKAAIRAGLRLVPRFHVPARAYYLMSGPVAAVTGLRDPATLRWRNPDLFWPDDRRWFVATDVDFWSLYIGGDDHFIRALVDKVPTPTETVALDRPLETED